MKLRDSLLVKDEKDVKEGEIYLLTNCPVGDFFVTPKKNVFHSIDEVSIKPFSIKESLRVGNKHYKLSKETARKIMVNNYLERNNKGRALRGEEPLTREDAEKRIDNKIKKALSNRRVKSDG